MNEGLCFFTVSAPSKHTHKDPDASLLVQASKHRTVPHMANMLGESPSASVLALMGERAACEPGDQMGRNVSVLFFFLLLLQGKL